MDEIITFEEQGFAGCLCQSVGKAIAKIEFCGVSTSLTEIAIGLTGEAGLFQGDGLNADVGFLKELVEAPTGNRIAASVDHQCAFNKVCCRYPAAPSFLNCPRTVPGARFIAQDRDNRRGIDNHRGRPRSS